MLQFFQRCGVDRSSMGTFPFYSLPSLRHLYNSAEACASARELDRQKESRGNHKGSVCVVYVLTVR